MGNPGVGKSTLSNALLGELQFKSGILDDGERVTKNFSFKETPYGFEVADSPGLSDISLID